MPLNNLFIIPLHEAFQKRHQTNTVKILTIFLFLFDSFKVDPNLKKGVFETLKIIATLEE